jgi:hypothetical protein
MRERGATSAEMGDRSWEIGTDGEDTGYLYLGCFPQRSTATSRLYRPCRSSPSLHCYWLMAESEPDWRYWEIERWQLNASAVNRSKIV